MAKKHDLDATATHKVLLLFTQLLFSGKRHWLPELAKQFNCSKATIMRLMETIEVSGVAEIASGIENRKRWYQLKHLPGTPYIGLTDDEVTKLALCRDLLERLLPEGVEHIVANGIAKISTLTEKAEDRGELTAAKAGRVSWGHIRYTQTHQEHMECLLKGIPAHTVCEVLYREEEHLFDSREPKRYEFVPMRLTVENDILYMEGWKVKEKGSPEPVHPMTLALHRVLSCQHTRLSLKDCPALPPYKGAFGLVGYESFPVRIEFSKDYASYIRERVWSEGQEIIDLPDGEIELSFQATSAQQLVSWVLSFGGEAELIEPEHVRQLLFEDAQYLYDFYAPESEEEE